MEKRVRKSKQCGQKQREERERAGNGISYIKMRSTVLSVEENKTRASVATTAPCARPNLSLKISAVCIKISAVIITNQRGAILPITTVCRGNQRILLQCGHRNQCLRMGKSKGKTSWPRKKPSVAKKHAHPPQQQHRTTSQTAGIKQSRQQESDKADTRALGRIFA